MSPYKPRKLVRVEDTSHKVRDKGSNPYDASGRRSIAEQEQRTELDLLERQRGVKP